jgi:benzoate transport
MINDPRELIRLSKMSFLQILVVAITIALNSLDGFDVLSISFAAPGIAKEWGIDRAALGIVLSMELIGMGFGSFLLGSLADKLGRRPAVLYCLVIMAAGMLMVTTVNSIFALSLWRIVTGFGIGGMLAATNAVVAEFSSSKRQHLCISLMAIGYPIGGVVGGSIASRLLTSHDWRAVFYLGAFLTTLLIPVSYFFMPESIHWLARKQPSGALDKINRTLRKFGHAAVERLPEISSEMRKESLADIFKPGLIATTLIITAGYSFHVVTWYFILKWVPKIVADLGFAAAEAGGVLVWANAGGALGGAIFGLLTLKFDLKKLTIAVLVSAAIFVSIFGRTPADLGIMSFFCLLSGFFCNAGINGFYALVALVFPTHVRAFGTGFMIGLGRGGAVLSPILAGFLFKSELGLPSVAMVMGAGSLFAGIMLIFLKLRQEVAADKTTLAAAASIKA